MKLLSFRGYPFEANGYTLGVETGDHIANWSLVPTIEPRMGADSQLTGATTSPRVIPVRGIYAGSLPFQQAMLALLGALEPDNDKPGTLVCDLFHDGTTIVSCEALPTFPAEQGEDGAVDILDIDFVTSDPIWRAVTATTATLTTTAADGALPLPVGGHTKVRPIVTLDPSAIRTVFSSVKGWRYKKTFTLTNTGTDTIDRFPYRMALGDTTPLTTAKMQADGDDVRIWFEGQDLPRTLVGMDTATTFVWFILDGFAAGEVRTYDLVYGNASATNPPTLAYPDLPPFTLATSTNAAITYATDETVGNAGLGLWFLDRGTKTPGRVDFDVPGAWRRFLMLENRDDYNQSRADSYVATGTKYHAILDAERRREGAVRLQDEGQADGIWAYWPTGIISITAPFRYLNIAQNSDNLVGTGKAVIMAREGGGESWETVFERSDVQNTEITIGSTTYSVSSPYPKEWYLGVLPQDEIEIPQSCRGTSKVQFRNGASFVVNTNTDSVITASALSAEVDIWDAYGTLQLVPGGDAPQYRADLGGAGGSGRLALPLTSNLVLDGERRTIEEQTSAGVLIARREFAGVFSRIEADGTVVPWHDWLLAKPRVNEIVNGAFPTDAASWTQVFVDTGITSTFTRDAAVFHTAVGSGKIAHSVNTGALGALVAVVNSPFIPSSPGLPFAIHGWVRTNNANVAPIFQVDWYNAAGVNIATSREGTWAPAINTWIERFYVPSAPTGAVTGRVNVLTINRSSSPGAANVYFDEVEAGINILTHTDLDTGVALTVEFREGFYG